MPHRANQQVCFIAGAGHSGSTLLGCILGSHSACFHGGEISKKGYKGYLKFLALNHELPETLPPEEAAEKRICKICGLQCPVWGDFVERDDMDIYEQISQKTGKSFIIDSTKKAEWIASQIQRLQNTDATISVIYLQRDGRAVVNSQMRKHPNKTPQILIEKWRTQIQETQRLFDQFAGRKMKVHYEELATSPSVVIARICELLEIDYQPDMLDFHQHEHHLLGGNCGTQFLAANRQIQHPEVLLTERTRYYYANHPPAIRLDVRWKDELDPAVQALFEALAGDINAEMRWEE